MYWEVIMGSSSSLLSQDVVTLVTHAGVLEACPVKFSYDPSDPLAVTLSVSSRDTGVEWTFARELLRDGLATIAGQGDVALFPDAGAVVIELNSSEGQIRLECAKQGIESFVAATYATVPEHVEADAIDINRWIEELLSQG